MKKVKAFERQGDMTHSAKNHVCDLCRCDKVAGENSGSADEYGIGVSCGHYGTGLCGTCRKHNRQETAERMWKEHAMTLQHGVVKTDYAEGRIVAEAQTAMVNQEVRDGLARVRDAIRKFDEADMLKPENWVTGRGGEEMSDEAKAELMLKVQKVQLDQAKVLADLAKTQFDFSKDAMIPLDVLRLWVVKIARLLQQVCPTRQEYDKAFQRFMAIMQETHKASMMEAAVEAGREGMMSEC